MKSIFNKTVCQTLGGLVERKTYLLIIMYCIFFTFSCKLIKKKNFTKSFTNIFKTDILHFMRDFGMLQNVVQKTVLRRDVISTTVENVLKTNSHVIL